MKPAGALSASLHRPGAAAVVIAHRGASAHVPENTLPAFTAAWEAGAQWVEADTQPTADGVPVILHDPDLDRTTSGSGPIREIPAAALRDMDLNGLPGARVPRLTDLLDQLTPERALLLEIKGDHSRADVEAVLAAVEDCRNGHRVLLQSFEVTALRHLRALDPARPIGLLVTELDDDPVGRCARLGATAYNPHHRTVLDNPGVVPKLRAAGIAVAVWTSDDQAEWSALTAAGVDAIITNTPAELLVWQAAQH
jgi:glycerophosphoryl diester phosphodiesterase